MSRLKEYVNRIFFYNKQKFLGEIQNYPCLYLSQMKSGTTYICNFFATLNQLNSGSQNIDLLSIYKYGIFRSDKPLSKKELVFYYDTYLKNIKNNHINFVQAHYLMNTDQLRDKILCTTRCIYDYVNSSYDFHFKKRNKVNKSKDLDLNEILQNYVEAHNQQKIAIQHANSYCIIKYDDLISEPEITFLKIIKFFTSENHSLDLVKKSVAMVSKSKIQEIEKKFSMAFNMEKSIDYKAKSFFRSNDKLYFTKNMINTALIKNYNLEIKDGYLSYE